MRSNRFLSSQALRALSCIILAACCTGCSFQREWNEHRPGKLDDIQGRWEGTWSSSGDGHSGPLRCVLTRTATETYRANFDATFAAVFHFGYVATLHGTPIGDNKVALSGEQDLGWIAGGVYRYKGEADRAEFHCTYESKADHGVFAMKRVD